MLLRAGELLNWRVELRKFFLLIFILFSNIAFANGQSCEKRVKETICSLELEEDKFAQESCVFRHCTFVPLKRFVEEPAQPLPPIEPLKKRNRAIILELRRESGLDRLNRSILERQLRNGDRSGVMEYCDRYPNKRVCRTFGL